jgi:molybdopterin synthase catalytic subunit
MKRSSVVTRQINPSALIDEVSSRQSGAISVFIGTVRDVNDGRGVSSIEYSAYQAMAETELARIVDEAEKRFGVSAVVVEHRIGLLELGEVSVTIAASHAHRASAFDCTRYIIEEIKKRVPIWKMEHYVDGTREWVDPTRNARVSSV